MSRAASITVGIGLVVLIGALVFWQNFFQAPIAISESMRTATTTMDAKVTSRINRMTVASHNSRKSCWTVINGNVYDLTSWIPQHPGGEQAILQLCGTDGSDTFNGQHGGAAKQAQILLGFKIGVAAP